ncbi:putative ATPase [Flavobacterium sp. 2755]|uniref:AAA family ATPase n=1 Tax=Flavobacterium sp. 2755 TaxID=2817765 RepID=UPI00285CDA48|nr:AAA family ATPase [Flavobacterium sp. 2755]MDR6761913.1 putative ATPase [Flavobacterium sp. 2755]
MINYLEIKGYKSIKNLKLELRPINILIGSNGVGKSNFVSFFKLINAIFNERLQQFVLEENADNLLYFGRKTTEFLFGKLIFDSGQGNNNAYRFNLAQTKEGGLFFESESSGYNVNRESRTSGYYTTYALQESNIPKNSSYRNNYLSRHLKNIQAFHFHDTSATSYLRRPCDVDDNLYLKQDGRNLPAFLYLLKVNHPKVYGRIEKTIQSVAPYIDRFILEPNRNRNNDNEIALRWIDKGDPESNFSAYQLSDGTLRFIALATLLLQPNPPSVIIIDEPELGLHPFAINILSGMVQIASSKAQIIVATQSPGLISNFKPEDVIAIDRNIEENQTVFKRLNSEDLNVWLQEFALGDLWERNIINSGQPFIKR